MTDHCFSAAECADMLDEHDIASPPDPSVTSSTSFTDCQPVEASFHCEKLHIGLGDAEVTSSTPMSTAFDKNAYMENIDIDSLQPTLSPVAGLSLTDLDKNPYSLDESLSLGDLHFVSECAAAYDTLLSRTEKSIAVTDNVFDPVVSLTLSAQAPLTADSLSSTDISADEVQEFLHHANKLNCDVMLSEGNQYNDESVCLDAFDVLQLADCYNTGPLIRTEDFCLDDAEWNCVQSWSSLIDHTTCNENFAVQFEENVPCFIASVSSSSFSGPGLPLSSNSLLLSKVSSASKQLRRSSRIQDNELRDLAQKIRQENQQKEHQECTKSQICSQLPVAHDVPEAEKMVKLVPCGITLERIKLGESQCSGGKHKYSCDNSLDGCKKHRSCESDDVVYNRKKHSSDSGKVESYSVTIHPSNSSAYDTTSHTGFKLKLTKITDKNGSAGNNCTSDFPKSPSKNVSKEHSRYVECCGPECHQPAAVASVYCSDACIQRCVFKFTKLQQKQQLGQYHMVAAAENVVMLERGSGKLVTGNHAPTTTTLLNWIRRHPTFEVVYPQHIQGQKTSPAKLSACHGVELKKNYDSVQKLRQVDYAVACQERKIADEQITQVSMHASRLRIGSDINEMATDTVKLQMDSPDVQKNSFAPTDAPAYADKHKHTSECAVKVRDKGKCSSSEKINTKETGQLHRKSDTSSRSHKMVENKASSKMIVGHKNHRNQLNDDILKSRSGKCHEKQTCHEIVPHHIRADVHKCSSKQRSYGEVGLHVNLVNETVNHDDRTKDKSGQRLETLHRSDKGTVDHNSKNSREVGDCGGNDKTVDARRLHVRNGICRALNSRLPELSNTSTVGRTRLKHLASKIEFEMYSFYGNVNSLYQRKYRALVKHLTDTSNKGLFRRVIYSDISPARLVQTNSQSLGSEQVAQWKGSESAAVASSSSILVLNSVLSYSCADSVSLVNVDTTSQHGQHVFDVSCQICTGQSGLAVSTRQCSSEPSKFKHTSDGLRRLATDTAKDKSQRCEVSNSVNESVLTKECDVLAVTVQAAVSQASCQNKSMISTSCESHEPLNLSVGSCNENVALKQDNNDKEHLDLADYSRSATNKQDSTNDELSTDSLFTGFIDKQIPRVALKTKPNAELIWHGTIVAPDVTNIDVTLHRVSGSMKFLRNDLPLVLPVMGRISPDVICDYLEKIKAALIVTREIAVVCFNATPGHEDAYNQLYCYLQDRGRCAVFGSIGPSIKDMYIWPLSSKSALPTILLPLDAPGLTTDQTDVLLGIVVQHCNYHQRVKPTILPREPRLSQPETRPDHQVSASISCPPTKVDQPLLKTCHAVSTNVSSVSSQQLSLSEGETGCSNECIGQLMQTVDALPSSDTMSAMLAKLTSSDNMSVDSKKQLLMQLIILMKTQVNLNENQLAKDTSSGVANAVSTLNSDATIEARNEMDKLMAWKTRIQNAIAEDPSEQQDKTDKHNFCSKIVSVGIESASLCFDSNIPQVDADGESCCSLTAKIGSIESPASKFTELNCQLTAQDDDCTMFVKASELSPPSSPANVSEITPGYELKPVVIECSSEFPPLSMPPKPPDNLLSMHYSFSTGLPVFPIPSDFSHSGPASHFVADNNTESNFVSDSPMSPPLMLDNGVDIDPPPPPPQLLHLGPQITITSSASAVLPHDDTRNQSPIFSPQLMPSPTSVTLPPSLHVLPKAALPTPPPLPVPPLTSAPIRPPSEPLLHAGLNCSNSRALVPSMLKCAQSAVPAELHSAVSHHIALKTDEVRNSSNRHDVDTNFPHQLLHHSSALDEPSSSSFKYALGNDNNHCQKKYKTWPVKSAVSVRSSNRSLHCTPLTDNVSSNNKVTYGDLPAPGFYLRQLLHNDMVAVDQKLSSISYVPVLTSFHSPQENVSQAVNRTDTKDDVIISRRNAPSSNIRLKAPPKPTETLQHSDTSAADPGSFSMYDDSTSTDHTMFACQTIGDGQSSYQVDETVELEDGEIVEADDKLAVQQHVWDSDCWPQATKQFLNLLISDPTRGSSTSHKVALLPADSSDISSRQLSYLEQHDCVHSARCQSDGQHQMSKRPTQDIRLFHDKLQAFVNSEQSHNWHLSRIQSARDWSTELTQPVRCHIPLDRSEKLLQTVSNKLSFSRSSDFVGSEVFSNRHEDPVNHAEPRNRLSVHSSGFVDPVGSQQKRPSNSPHSQLSQLSNLHSSAFELSRESGRELMQPGRSRLPLRRPRDSSEPQRFETYTDFSSGGTPQDSCNKYFGFM